MKCHLCGAAAVDRCYTCGQLFCEQHGRTDCSACTEGIALGDPRPDRFTAERREVPRTAKPWWRPQEAEDFHPPACYACGGLTRNTCSNCTRPFCPDHAGSGHLCRECYRSGSMGFLAMGLLVLVLVLLAVWGWLL